eukprot:SAG22_NODE_1945_length_3279_cov_1.768239_4_plen_165_part_00
MQDGGGALMNQAIHSVDLLLWLMGDVSSVSGAQTATLAHERVEVEDVAVASVRFANGALGCVEASTATFPGSLKRVEVSGARGSVVLEEENVAAWAFQSELPVRWSMECVGPWLVRWSMVGALVHGWCVGPWLVRWSMVGALVHGVRWSMVGALVHGVRWWSCS